MMGNWQLILKMQQVTLEYKRECEKYVLYDDIASLLFALNRLFGNLDEFLQRGPEFLERKELQEFYLNLRSFMSIYELVDEHYVIYTEHEEDGRFKLRLYCVDPSLNLQERIDKGNATIFFSATLLPVNYYKSLLSTKKDNYAVYAQTAFSEEQRTLLFGNDVSKKYTRRNAEYEKIASYILKTVQAKKGNYMIFFPSYQMMYQVYEVFCELDGGWLEMEAECLPEEEENANGTALKQTLHTYSIVQKSNMREAEREEFLRNFSEENTRMREKSLAAFCVLGGIFGEGIDLKNEQLIGAVIVGTGLPQISNEREILKNYYDRRQGMGFDYAYRYPGINKVLQAAGRVIRTVEDVGVIVLLDERFLQSDYQPLFPREWAKRTVCNVGNIEEHLRNFWDE